VYVLSFACPLIFYLVLMGVSGKNIIQRLVEMDPQARLSMTQAKAHPWFAKHRPAYDWSWWYEHHGVQTDYAEGSLSEMILAEIQTEQRVSGVLMDEDEEVDEDAAAVPNPGRANKKKAGASMENAVTRKKEANAAAATSRVTRTKKTPGGGKIPKKN
jgi:hypothetical protein